MPISACLDRRYLLPALGATFLLSVSFPLHAQPADSSADQARSQIAAALTAMGGESQLRAIKTMGWKAIGHRYMREQSERPTGPWLLDYFQISQLRDLEHRRLREERQSRGCNSTECWKSAESQSATFVFADGAGAYLQGTKFQPAPPDTARDAFELLALAPEQILLEALAAPDLHAESSVSFHGFPHNVVSFRHSGAPIRIFLNPGTNLPACAEITRPVPDSFFWGPWGDVTTRFVWTFWQLEPGGMHYPRQWNIESNGRPDWTLTINELTFNPPAAPDQFIIPAELVASLRSRPTIDQMPFGRSGVQPAELVSGIIQVRGSWNVAEIRTDEGIYIIEGPISNGYSARAIEDAQRRFPGLPIKGVITTSDAWPHIGGLREYAARGIPIYALDLNEPILHELFTAPYSTFPDDLAKNSRQPDLHLVSKRTSLGAGDNRMELIPLRTQTGERQFFVYLPGRKLLYASDLFQRDQTGAFFLPQTLSEAVDVVHREKLTVDTVFGMHLSPTPWKTIEEFVASQLTAVTTK